MVGLFYVYNLANSAMTNKQLQGGYFNNSNTQALKDYFLKTLRDRASYGDSDAKRIVSQIERSLGSK